MPILLLDQEGGVKSSEKDIAAIMRAEANRMRAAVGQADTNGKVHMSAGQFRQLADLISQLCDCIPDPDPGSFADRRFWIPIDQFEKLKKRVNALEQSAALATELRYRSIGRA
jgi:hypothetical protein